MSDRPPGMSSDSAVEAAFDPVVEIITDAGLDVDPGVRTSGPLAAGASLQQPPSKSAAEAAVTRSTFLWALWRLDDTVGAAFERRAGRLEMFERILGIGGDPRPSVRPFVLSRELTRALRTFAAAHGRESPTVTLPLLGVAVLEDVVSNDGPLGDRLRQLGAPAADVLASLQGLLNEQAAPSTEPLVRVRDLTPQRFGVHLPSGVEELGPYVPRDADSELDRLLREHPWVIAVVAPPMSGAVRTVFESLRRVRLDDQILLLHEHLNPPGGGGRVPVDLDRWWHGEADVVWIRDLRTAPGAGAFLELNRQRGDLPAATVVFVLRPEDRERVAELGLLSDGVVELDGRFSEHEKARARALYGGNPESVSALAGAAPRHQGALRASYHADSAITADLVRAESDYLDIQADVDMLAKLIASTHVDPPLSIGLFGPWGSGKSFLIRQLQLRIRDLSARSRRLPQDASPGYLREILAVEFNAWQYAHGSALWAALINRVFEQIQEQLGGDQRYQQVLRDIAAKNVSVKQAHERVDKARAQVEQSRPAGEDRRIGEVAKDHDMSAEATKKLEKGLSLDAASEQIGDLQREYDQLRTTTSRLSKGWATASSIRRAAVVIPVGLCLVFVGVSLFWPAAQNQLVALATGILSILAVVTQVLRPVNQGLEQAAKLLRADDADKRELQRAEEALDRATKELAAAKASGQAGLYGFVSERSSSAEYRQYLGMAPMIRDDLQRLADMSKEEGGIPGIDRIVIFIDDLDRCPAAEVVRVLEAVNLLFAFRLFVVVVAVDSRWLLRSLEGTFGDAFDPDDSSAPTPQNYLEKIIQIPFWIQPMETTGFGRLVTSLAGEVDEARGGLTSAHQAEVVSSAAVSAVDDQPFHGPSGGGEEGSVGEVDSEHSASTTGVADGVLGTSAQGREADRSGDEAPDDGREDDLNPEALQLSAAERDFMLQFLPLVSTPRAVKRFLNTYQLLRVSIDDVDAYLSARTYEPVLILLAMMTGTVPITDQMIDDLASMTQVNFASFLNDTLLNDTFLNDAVAVLPPGEIRQSADQLRSVAWTPIAAACADLPTNTLTPEVISAWLPKVARYSFHHV